MIYVTSDLHGYPLREFKRLLEQICFCEEDFLYILGDVIDHNGDGGIALLQWIMMQPNVELILGNHEAMLLASSKVLFSQVTDDALDGLTSEDLGVLSNWMFNGGGPTIASLKKLNDASPEAVMDLLDFLREAPLYEAVTAGGRDYLLLHAGMENFAPGRPMRDYGRDELLWHRPAKDERYLDDVTLILGHTPTAYYGTPGRAYHADTWIDIDTGAAQGGHPMLLRLDDLREFYPEEAET